MCIGTCWRCGLATYDITATCEHNSPGTAGILPACEGRVGAEDQEKCQHGGSEGERHLGSLEDSSEECWELRLEVVHHGSNSCTRHYRKHRHHDRAHGARVEQSYQMSPVAAARAMLDPVALAVLDAVVRTARLLAPFTLVHLTCCLHYEAVTTGLVGRCRCSAAVHSARTKSDHADRVALGACRASRCTAVESGATTSEAGGAASMLARAHWLCYCNHCN